MSGIANHDIGEHNIRLILGLRPANERQRYFVKYKADSRFVPSQW